MFQFFNQAGFPVALAKVAQAMSISREKIMDGADAPQAWRAGNHQKVMDYCLGDCQMSNQIILAIQQTEEVIQDPEPDQSWMDTPMPSSLSDLGVRREGKTGLSHFMRNFEANSGSL